MISSRDEIYINGQYLENAGFWSVEDSVWKADLVFDLDQKNGLHPKSIVEVRCGVGAISKALQKKDAGIIKFDGFIIFPQVIFLAKATNIKTREFHQVDFLQKNFSVPDFGWVFSSDSVEPVKNSSEI